MELVNACMTPRDNITSYDYTKPLINDVLVGGGVLGKLKDIPKGLAFGVKVAKDKYDKKKKKVFAMSQEKRQEMREDAYKNFVKFLGFIFYLFYLPLKPWIWMMTETFKKFQRIYAGTIVPL